MRRTSAGAANFLEATVGHERDPARLEPFAKDRTISVRKGVIQDGARQAIMLNKQNGVPERVGRCDMGSALFKRHGNVHGNQGLVFHDEKTDATKNRMFHKCSTGAAKREEPEARGDDGRLCPKPSINPQTRNKRYDRLGRQSPHSWSGLGAA
jgi:hypothetical protein